MAFVFGTSSVGLWIQGLYRMYVLRVCCWNKIIEQYKINCTRKFLSRTHIILINKFKVWIKIKFGAILWPYKFLCNFGQKWYIESLISIIIFYIFVRFMQKYVPLNFNIEYTDELWKVKALCYCYAENTTRYDTYFNPNIK